MEFYGFFFSHLLLEVSFFALYARKVWGISSIQQLHKTTCFKSSESLEIVIELIITFWRRIIDQQRSNDRDK